ncbi:hypothetical protein CCP3SC15_1980001 [Gammaproteobacteria bacterium]
MRDEDQKKEMGRNLARLRNQRGWTGEKLAEMISSNAGHVSQMENGVRGIGAKVMPKICKALGITPNDLYGVVGGESENKPSGGELAPPADLSPEKKLLWDSIVKMTDDEALEMLTDYRRGIRDREAKR